MAKERRGDRAKDGSRLLVKVGRQRGQGAFHAGTLREIANGAFQWAVAEGRAEDDPATRGRFVETALRWLQREMKAPDERARWEVEEGRQLGVEEREVERAPDAAHARLHLMDGADTCDASATTVELGKIGAVAQATGLPEAGVEDVLLAFLALQAR